MRRFARLYLSCLLFILTGCSLGIAGCHEDEGPVCGAGSGANSSAVYEDCKIRMNGTATESNGTGFQDGVPVWTDDIVVNLESPSADCWHGFVIVLHNVQEGTPVPGNQSINGSFTWQGVYNGELGTASLSDESSIRITELTDESISGSFTAILETGTVFTDGRFSGVSFSQ